MAKKYIPEKMVRISRYQNYFPTLPAEVQQDVHSRMEELLIEEKWYCDKGNYEHMAQILTSILNNRSFSSVNELMTAFNREIMSRNNLLDALAKNNMTDILHSTHIKYFNFFTPYFRDLDMNFSKRESACALSILSGALCSYIAWWIKNGKKETPEQLTSIVSKCFNSIAKVTL